jgi:hypothetical protein
MKKSILAQAFTGLVEDTAKALNVSDKRIYEMLGRDNPYNKLWRLLNELGKRNPNQLRIIQADFNAKCSVWYPRLSAFSTWVMHEKVSFAVTSILAKTPKDERRTAILTAIAELNKQLEQCDNEV